MQGQHGEANPSNRHEEPIAGTRSNTTRRGGERTGPRRWISFANTDRLSNLIDLQTQRGMTLPTSCAIMQERFRVNRDVYVYVYDDEALTSW